MAAVEVLEYAVHAADARPLLGRLAGQRVGVVRFADVEQVEGRAVLGKAHLAQHGAHVVMGRHEAVAVEAVIQDGVRVEHGEGNHGVRGVAQALLQERGQVHAGHHGFEIEALGAQALVELEEVLRVVLGGVDVARARVRHEAGEQVEVRGRCPGGVRPTAFDAAELLNYPRAGTHEGVVAATIEDNQDVMIEHRGTPVPGIVRYLAPGCRLSNSSMRAFTLSAPGEFGARRR